MNFKKVLLFTIFLILTSKYTNAQLFYIYPFDKGWSIGGCIGLNYFYGDVNDNKGRIWNNTPFNKYYYTDKNIMGNFILSKKINRFINLRGEVIFGRLSGTDEKANLHFDGNINSFMIIGYFNFVDYFFNRTKSDKTKFYAFGGIGLSNFNSICRINSTKKIVSTIGYDSGLNKIDRTTETTINIGLEAIHNLDKSWSIFFNTSLFYLNTDKLDSYRSNKSGLEGYGYMALGIIYNFDFKIRTQNSTWEKSSGNNNSPYNPGVHNKRKKKLHNKWKR